MRDEGRSNENRELVEAYRAAADSSVARMRNEEANRNRRAAEESATARYAGGRP
jgi:hypothetical protein